MSLELRASLVQLHNKDLALIQDQKFISLAEEEQKRIQDRCREIFLRSAGRVYSAPCRVEFILNTIDPNNLVPTFQNALEELKKKKIVLSPQDYYRLLKKVQRCWGLVAALFPSIPRSQRFGKHYTVYALCGLENGKLEEAERFYQEEVLQRQTQISCDFFEVFLAYYTLEESFDFNKSVQICQDAQKKGVLSREIKILLGKALFSNVCDKHLSNIDVTSFLSAYTMLIENGNELQVMSVLQRTLFFLERKEAFEEIFKLYQKLKPQFRQNLFVVQTLIRTQGMNGRYLFAKAIYEQAWKNQYVDEATIGCMMAVAVQSLDFSYVERELERVESKQKLSALLQALYLVLVSNGHTLSRAVQEGNFSFAQKAFSEAKLKLDVDPILYDLMLQLATSYGEVDFAKEVFTESQTRGLDSIDVYQAALIMAGVHNDEQYLGRVFTKAGEKRLKLVPQFLDSLALIEAFEQERAAASRRTLEQGKAQTVPFVSRYLQTAEKVFKELRSAIQENSELLSHAEDAYVSMLLFYGYRIGNRGENLARAEDIFREGLRVLPDKKKVYEAFLEVIALSADPSSIALAEEIYAEAVKCPDSKKNPYILQLAPYPSSLYEKMVILGSNCGDLALVEKYVAIAKAANSYKVGVCNAYIDALLKRGKFEEASQEFKQFGFAISGRNGENILDFFVNRVATKTSCIILNKHFSGIAFILASEFFQTFPSEEKLMVRMMHPRIPSVLHTYRDPRFGLESSIRNLFENVKVSGKLEKIEMKVAPILPHNRATIFFHRK